MCLCSLTSHTSGFKLGLIWAFCPLTQPDQVCVILVHAVSGKPGQCGELPPAGPSFQHLLPPLTPNHPVHPLTTAVSGKERVMVTVGPITLSPETWMTCGDQITSRDEGCIGRWGQGFPACSMRVSHSPYLTLSSSGMFRDVGCVQPPAPGLWCDAHCNWQETQQVNICFASLLNHLDTKS